MDHGLKRYKREGDDSWNMNSGGLPNVNRIMGNEGGHVAGLHNGGGMVGRDIPSAGFQTNVSIPLELRAKPFGNNFTAEIQRYSAVFVARTANLNRTKSTYSPATVVSLPVLHMLLHEAALRSNMSDEEVPTPQSFVDDWRFYGIMHTSTTALSMRSNERVINIHSQGSLDVRNYWGDAVIGGSYLWFVVKMVKIQRYESYVPNLNGNVEKLGNTRQVSVKDKDGKVRTFNKKVEYVLRLIPTWTRDRYVPKGQLYYSIEDEETGVCEDHYGIPIRVGQVEKNPALVSDSDIYDDSFDRIRSTVDMVRQTSCPMIEVKVGVGLL